MGSITFPNEGCSVAVLLAPWAIAACGGSGFGASPTGLDGGPTDRSESAAPSDASASPEVQSPGDDVTLPSATAFADVNVAADFTQPVELAPPATTIAGDTASLVGSWDQLADDGSVCTPATAPSGTTCFHLHIREDDAGAVEGTIHGDAPNTTPPPIMGPFAPATDPRVGYPPNLSPSDYSCAEHFAGNVDYRILDGVVDSGSFTFWFSALDLWSAWCALQTPYAWNVRGATKYLCLPQTATPANTDVGKFALCMSEYDGPLCTDNSGNVQLCACLVGGDGGMFNDSLPGCGPTACECSATQCRANLRGAETSATFTLEGGKLVGVIQIDVRCGAWSPYSPITLQRATQ